jgi:hypothetical protein
VVKNIMTFNREQAERALPTTTTATTTTGSASSKTDFEVLPLQGGAGPEGINMPDEDVEASSPYDLAKRHLKEARPKLITQSIEANETLVRVHQHYERKLQLVEDASDRPSAPDA